MTCCAGWRCCAGGSTAAALLAKAALSVLVLERDSFPRYHIGESLLSSCQSTLKLSGAYDAVNAESFQVKRCGVVLWGDDTWVLGNSWSTRTSGHGRSTARYAMVRMVFEAGTSIT